MQTVAGKFSLLVSERSYTYRLFDSMDSESGLVLLDNSMSFDRIVCPCSGPLVSIDFDHLSTLNEIMTFHLLLVCRCDKMVIPRIKSKHEKPRHYSTCIDYVACLIHNIACCACP